MTQTRALGVKGSIDGRVPWVDYAKGICIILVVMMHTSNHIHQLVGTSSFMEGVVLFAQPFRMPDFFLVSGLFMAAVINRPWRVYLDKKVVHFAYFYLLWVMIYFAFKAPVWIMGGNWSKFADLPLTLVQPLGTMWFIYVLPIFFVVTKALHDRKVSMVLVWLVAAGLETLRVQTGSVVIDEFCARYVYFLSGYLFATKIFDAAEWARNHVQASVAFVAIWFVANGLAVFGPNPLTSTMSLASMPIVSLVFGFAGALAIVIVAALLEKGGLLGFIRYCGEKSIVIYLAFFLTLTPLQYVVRKTGIDVGTGILLVTIISVIVPLMMERIVRHTPLKFLFVRPAWCHIDAGKPRQGAMERPASASATP